MTDAPKITLVLPNLGGGGAERVTVSLANAIAARGIETTFVVGQAEGPYLKDVSDKVRLLDLQVPQIRKAVPGLVKHFNKDKPDAVLSALTHANLAVLVAAQRAKKGPRIIVAEHNSTKMLMHGNKLPKRLLKRYMIRKLYPTADEIVLVSRDMRPDFAKFISLPVERFTPIHNPIMPAQPVGPTYQIHPWLAEKTTPVVIGAGRLSEQKDFGTLIKAFDKMRDRTAARLIIFGEGPDREKLEKLRNELGLEDRVDLPGFVSNLSAELAQSDLFAMSSLWEGLPMVLLEALAVGTPVVCTDCPTGPDEILENGKWGRLVPMSDPSALARGIYSALENPLKVPTDQVLARFDMDFIVDQYLSTMLPEGAAKKAVA